jgi:hypothetical protein
LGTGNWLEMHVATALISVPRARLKSIQTTAAV